MVWKHKNTAHTWGEKLGSAVLWLLVFLDVRISRALYWGKIVIFFFIVFSFAGDWKPVVVMNESVPPQIAYGPVQLALHCRCLSPATKCNGL